MTARSFGGALAMILMSVWFTPWLDELLKVYVVAVVVLITLLVNTLFWWTRLRETIINHLVVAIVQRVLMDPDIQKLIDWTTRRSRVYDRIKEELKKRETQAQP
jgi:Flp pilus assembly protein TadB